eukprot:1003974-Pyramimonas_sp.AAC.1
MHDLRTSAISVLSRERVVRRGQPSDDAAAFRSAVMGQYLDTARQSKLRRATLAAALRCDWRNHERVEVLIGWGQSADLSTITEHLSWGI